MRFRVSHESVYQYDVPVRPGEHLVRLTPRPQGVGVLSHQLSIEPEPSSRSDEVDSSGNVLTRVRFAGETRLLRFRSRFELDTLPVSELLAGTFPLPATQMGGTPIHPDVRALASRIAGEVGGDTVAFLDRLSQVLFTRMERHIRPTGDARPAHETLALGSGACRDLTVLFVDTCAAVGLLGRFVSGYQASAQTPDGQRHLHAWGEVLLPGVGYRGWDPMHGVRVLDGHVALFAAPTQPQTMPVEGSFTFVGTTVNTTLDNEVRIATD